MGHHASKHKNNSSGTKTTSRLSSSSKPTKSTSISNSKPGSVPKPTSTSTLTSSQKFTKESRPLGSKDNEDISNGINNNNNNNIPMNAREALARAAEERYKKLQEQKMGQSDRLRAKAKQSKNDKGL